MLKKYKKKGESLMYIERIKEKLNSSIKSIRENAKESFSNVKLKYIIQNNRYVVASVLALSLISLVTIGNISGNLKTVDGFNKVYLLSESGIEKEKELDIDKLINESYKYSKVGINGYTIYADDKNVGFFKNERDAKRTIDEVMTYFVDDNEKIVDSYFKENVRVEPYKSVAGEFTTFDGSEEALKYVLRGTDEERTHKVKKGENFWIIAENYGISVDNLVVSNPKVKPERLQINQEISLVVPKPLITVATVEDTVYEESIAYATEYIDDSSIYKGDNRIKISGKKGVKEIAAKIIKENGIVVEKEILTEKVISNPVKKIVRKGTKNPPPKKGTGSFALPYSRGYNKRVTSNFGNRSLGRHNGIDIGMPTGSAIKAADGGVVVFSGYQGTYGYVVKIDHGGNLQTIYAHNSKLKVRKGDRVFKGQTISLSGNTGRSTGPHLHFEVRKNGTPINPRNYLSF
jgi:murein DD-endopeptidase MepM/ murein hydrolase activator NlpD